MVFCFSYKNCSFVRPFVPSSCDIISMRIISAVKMTIFRFFEDFVFHFCSDFLEFFSPFYLCSNHFHSDASFKGQIFLFLLECIKACKYMYLGSDIKVMEYEYV